MASRIFVKGLPPTVTEKELRKHFSAKGDVTDVKIYPQRRIGFVGYRNPAVAEEAVKYFNRTFIRMSKLTVELAKPIAAAKPASTAGSKKGLRPISRPCDGMQDASSKGENTNKRKRQEVDESDPKFQEYLQAMQPSTKRKLLEVPTDAIEDSTPPVAVDGDRSDDEYDDHVLARRQKRSAVDKPLEETASQAKHPLPKQAPDPIPDAEGTASQPNIPVTKQGFDSIPDPAQSALPNDATDDDWLRSRTSRVLDLIDDDAEIAPVGNSTEKESGNDDNVRMEPDESPGSELPGEGKTPESAETENKNKEASPDDPISMIQKTSRLYIRNIPYSATNDDLTDLFGKYGELLEAHVSVDATGKCKGFAFIHYVQAESAIEAFQALDGVDFQGRLLHILPGEAKRHQGLDEAALAKLPLKQQNLIRKRAEASKRMFAWNSLYMSQDAVNASVADRMGVSKSDLLDRTSADAAVKQAIAETSIIQDTKTYFVAHGVNLESFKSRERGGTAILVKNFPFGTTVEELRSMFQEHGKVLQVLMPPNGTIAIVHFALPGEAEAAFGKLRYRRFKTSWLFLEKAPKDLFVHSGQTAAAAAAATPTAASGGPSDGVQKLSVTDLLERDDDVDEVPETSSLYVRNLNFSTTSEELTNAFKHIDGFVSALVRTKPDPKTPGKVLSWGFGFVEFRSKAQALAAIPKMDGHTLAGHKLVVKASHRGLDAAEERRLEDAAKKAANQRTKIVVKNLPFEATKKDVRSLLGTYGQLRGVRVPKKFDHSSRGFAFAEFVTPREAANAISALRNTHLLGRKLVIDYAETETVDAEEEIAKMQRKVGGQVKRLALQQLTSRARTKVDIGDEEAEEPLDDM